MRAGDTIRAEDSTAAAGAARSDTINNLTNTAFEEEDPPCVASFIAPTSGTVLVIVGGGLRDNSSTNRIHGAPQIHHGGPSGPIVFGPSISKNSFTNSTNQTTRYQYMSRMVPVYGLIPGEAYFVRVMNSVSSGTTADIFNRQVFVIPTAG